MRLGLFRLRRRANVDVVEGDSKMSKQEINELRPYLTDRQIHDLIHRGYFDLYVTTPPTVLRRPFSHLDFNIPYRISYYGHLHSGPRGCNRGYCIHPVHLIKTGAGLQRVTESQAVPRIISLVLALKTDPLRVEREAG